MKYVNVFLLIVVLATGCAESDFSAKQEILQEAIGGTALSFGTIETPSGTIETPSGTIETPSGTIETLPPQRGGEGQGIPHGCGFYYDPVPGYSCERSSGTFGNIYYCCSPNNIDYQFQ